MKSQSASFRNPVSSSATLVFKDGTSRPCVVKNVSAGGAKIHLEGDAAVPDDFHLQADDLNVNADVEVIWRVGADLGVRFLARQRLARPGSGEARSEAVRQPISLATLTARGPRPAPLAVSAAGSTPAAEAAS